MTLERTLDRAATARGAFGGARGRVVLWPLANTAEAVATFISALAEGVVPVVIPVGWPRGKLDATRALYPRFGLFAGDAIDLPADPATSDGRVSLALLTSGSTGAPKVIATSLANLDRGIQAIHAAQELSDVASTGALLPLAYSYALVNQLLWSVRFERQLTHTAGLAMPADTLRQLREAETEMICLVGHQARLLQRYGFGARDALPAVKVVNFAGAPFPVSCLADLRVLFPEAEFVNNYGCAEAMPRLTVKEMAGAETDATAVGGPIDGIELRIDGDEPVGPITFRGPSASLGILEASGELVPHPEWIASGDLGRIDNGELYVLGRHDQVVKVFGERISLVEIEEALRASGAHEAMAWVGNDGAGGDAIQGVVGGDAAPGREALAAAFAERLPRNLWPKDVRYTKAWPTLDNGKTDRQKLKAMFGDLPAVWPLPPSVSAVPRGQ